MCVLSGTSKDKTTWVFHPLLECTLCVYAREEDSLYDDMLRKLARDVWAFLAERVLRAVPTIYQTHFHVVIQAQQSSSRANLNLWFKKEVAPSTVAIDPAVRDLLQAAKDEVLPVKAPEDMPSDRERHQTDRFTLDPPAKKQANSAKGALFPAARA